jgi:hypothetical protein
MDLLAFRSWAVPDLASPLCPITERSGSTRLNVDAALAAGAEDTEAPRSCKRTAPLLHTTRLQQEDEKGQGERGEKAEQLSPCGCTWN